MTPQASGGPHEVGCLYACMLLLVLICSGLVLLAIEKMVDLTIFFQKEDQAKECAFSSFLGNKLARTSFGERVLGILKRIPPIEGGIINHSYTNPSVSLPSPYYQSTDQGHRFPLGN